MLSRLIDVSGWTAEQWLAATILVFVIVTGDFKCLPRGFVLLILIFGFCSDNAIILYL